MQAEIPFQRILKRDRTIVLAGLVSITVLSWAYMLYLAWDMGRMAMPQMHSWGSADFVLVFVMWAVMMVAMMIPSAAPMILTFAAVERKRAETTPLIATATFVLGYLAIWTGYSALATVAQWGLHTSALLTSMMGGQAGPVVGGVILLAAGGFQLSSLKHACLKHCRTPLGFLLEDWREGTVGAFIMGLEHGSYCAVCCWALMALMFVAGVMNVLWMAIIAVLVLVEKVAPAGHWLGRVTGILLLAWGGWMLAAHLIALM